MTRMVLFSTPHGSHLYGLAHAGSDRDRYTVVARLPHVDQRSRARYARQTINGAGDEFVIDLSTWLQLCEKGVPQALEAMWSRTPTVDLLGDFRSSYRAGTAVIPTYLRTIRSFARADGFKRRRHAARLALNARAIIEDGHFNPLLTPEQIAWTTQVASEHEGEELIERIEPYVWGHLSRP